MVPREFQDLDWAMIIEWEYISQSVGCTTHKYWCSPAPDGLILLVVGIIGLRVAVRISWASNCTASSGWYNLQPLSTSSGWNECSVWWMWCRSSGLLCPGCCWISPWVTAGIKICSLVFHIWILRFKSATVCASNVSYSFDQVHWPSQKRECLVFFDASLNKLMLPFFLLTQFLFVVCCCWLFEQYLNISI